MKKDLVQIIKDNPGAQAIIDNDNWQLYREKPKDFEAWSDDERDDWWSDASNKLADSRNVERIGRGYGSGNCYGGDILQALAVIVGIKVESV